MEQAQGNTSGSARRSGVIPAALADKVRDEQVRVLYRNLLPVLGGNYLVSVLMAIAMRGLVDDIQLLIWTASVYVLSTARIPLFLAYRRRDRHRQAHRRWGYYFVLSSFLSGVVWGAAGIAFFLPDNPFMLTLLTLVIMGMVAGSTSSLASYLPAHMAFILPCGLPLSVNYLLVDQPTFYILGILLVFYMAMNVVFSRTFQRTFIDSIVFRLENAELVADLTHEKEKAIEASATKSRFLASASHDLRQPLHALGLFVGAMEAHSTSAELHGLIDKTKASVHALEGLMDSLLDISKLDAGVVQPRMVDTPVGTLIENIRSEFTTLSEEKGIRFRARSSKFWTHTDPAMLERILRNLVSNAIRYTDVGCVLVGCRIREDRLVIEVRDTGNGIPKEKQQDIFREFHQLENPERDRTKGLGLGLAIVDRLSQLLLHPVSVWSEPGRGSIFRIEVPRLPPREYVPTQEPAPSLNLLEGIHVLVVDDEVAIREGMQTLLGSWGCQVTLAESSKDACKQLRRMNWSPDVIIADFRLREGETGLAAIEAVRGMYDTIDGGVALEPIPAIVLTGETAAEQLKEVKASGFPLLHKPLRPARLRATLHRLVTV